MRLGFNVVGVDTELADLITVHPIINRIRIRLQFVICIGLWVGLFAFRP